MALDEVLLEVQRLYLRARDDHLDVGDPVRQRLDLGAAVLGPLEVRAHARAERLRLADIEDVALPVAEEVDARLRREAFELVFEPVRHGHGYRSQGDVADSRGLGGNPGTRAGGPGGRPVAPPRRHRGRRALDDADAGEGADGPARPRRL